MSWGRPKRKGIEGLPDTYDPVTGTGAQVAQTPEEAREIYAQLPKGSAAEQQELMAESKRRYPEWDGVGAVDEPPSWAQPSGWGQDQGDE